MVRLFRYLRSLDIIFLIIILGMVFASVYLDLKIPDYMTDITASLAKNSTDVGPIWTAGLKMLACALGSAAVSVVTGLLSSYIAANFSKTLREKLYDKVSVMSQADIEKYSIASLITRTTNDVTQIQIVLAMGLGVLLKAPVLGVWAVIKIFDKGTTGWVIAVGVAIAVLIVLVAGLIVYAVPKFKIIQKQTDDVNLIERESLNGLRVIKAFNAEKYQDGKFEKVNKNLTKTNTVTGLAVAFMSPVMTGIMSGLSLSIFWIGAYAISDAALMDKMTIFTNMIVFSSYAMQVVMAFIMLVIIAMILPRALVAGKRVREVIDSPITVAEGDFSGVTKEKGILAFDHVSFSYGDAEGSEKVLSDISFTIEKGQTLAIIGSTGSGKSTLASLAMRLYDPNQGSVTLDGVNLKTYSFKTLYDKIALIPQRAVMFTGTVKENIAYGDSLGGKTQDLEKALEVSQSAEFVAKKDKGLESEIEEGGKNFSGGQKQRIAIARALARKPEIIIFDDSFSALDYKTDFTLRSELSKNYEGLTKIIIAQRIGTIKNADEIIVLDNGKIVGKGTHEELMASCETYKEIALSQLSEEELANA